MDLKKPITQADFAAAVGINRQNVGAMVRAGLLPQGASAGEWLHRYCARLREQAAGRMGSDDRLSLADERAALASAQRQAQEMKNA